MKNVLSITIILVLLISGCNKDEPTIPIIVDFSANSVSISAGESVTFTDLSSGNPTSWEWTFEGGDPESSSDQNPTVVFNTAGEYTITLVASNDQTSGEEEKINYISVNVISDFSASTQRIYAGESVTFTDKSKGSPDMWKWTFEGGDPESSSDQNPVVIYREVGLFDVVLETSHGQLSDTETKADHILVITKPIAHFPLDGDAIDEIEGVVSGNINGAVLTTDRNNESDGAYELDGTDDHINFGDVFDFGTSDFTISMWTKIDEFKGEVEGTGSSGAWILNKGITIFGTPTRSGYGIKSQKINDENHLLFFVGGATNQTYSAGGTGNFNIDQWYHIVGRREGNKISLYVNGSLIFEQDIESDLDTNTNIPFSIGRQNKLGNDPAGTTYFDGSVDEIRLFDKALSSEEIIRLSTE